MFVICIYVFALSSLAFVCSLTRPAHIAGLREKEKAVVSSFKSSSLRSLLLSTVSPTLIRKRKNSVFFSSTEFLSTPPFIIYPYNVSNFFGTCSCRLKRCTFVRATVNKVGAAHVIVDNKVKHRAREPLRNLLKLNTSSTKHFSSTFSELYIVSIVLCAADEAGVVTRAAGQKRPRLSLSEDFKSLISTTV